MQENSVSCWERKLCLYVLFICKLALDIAVLVTVVYQLEPIKLFQGSLNLENACQPMEAVCLSNIRDLLVFSRSAFWSGIASVVFLVMAIITDVGGFLAICLTKEKPPFNDILWIILSVVSLMFNAFGFWCILAANGYLWNGMIQYTTQIPQIMIASLRFAILNGIAPVVLSFLLGCPAAVIICVLLVIANKN